LISLACVRVLCAPGGCIARADKQTNSPIGGLFTDCWVGGYSQAQDTPTQELELAQQVRRMGHHASVVVWSGCNECGNIGALTNVIAREDNSRAIRAASPAPGYSTGVHTLTGFPNGAPLNPLHSPPKPPGA
jgi:hypothetical protein